MKELIFDTGLITYKLNDTSEVTFNPTDSAFVERFFKTFDALGGTIKRMGGMIKRVFVFSLITSGLHSVRTQRAAYLNLNEQFTTAHHISVPI